MAPTVRTGFCSPENPGANLFREMHLETVIANRSSSLKARLKAASEMRYDRILIGDFIWVDMEECGKVRLSHDKCNKHPHI